MSAARRHEPEIEILEIVGVNETERDEAPATQTPPRGAILDEGRRDGVRTILRELLPPLDDLEQCIRARPDASTLEEGVRLALRHLWNVFRKQNLERIEGEGVAFDPEVHEAAIVTPTDRVEPGIILEVMRVGYKVGGELVRPALVRVSGPAGSRRP